MLMVKKNVFVKMDILLLDKNALNAIQHVQHVQVHKQINAIHVQIMEFLQYKGIVYHPVLQDFTLIIIYVNNVVQTV